MKIINLVRSEFIKNYSIKKLLICIIVLTLASLFIITQVDGLLLEYSKNNNSEYEKVRLIENVESIKKSYEKVNKKEDKTFDEKYLTVYYQNYIKYTEQIINNNKTFFNNDWKYELINYDGLLSIISDNFYIDLINESDEEVIRICSKHESESAMVQQLIDMCNLNNEEREELYNKNKKMIADYEKLLNQDKYYLYVQYMVDNNLIEEDEFTKLIIDKKIENNDSFIYKNYIQYQRTGEYTDYGTNENRSYAFNNNIKNKTKENRAILLYGAQHNIKTDILYNYYQGVNEDTMYLSPKLKVNRIYHLSIVVMILISITSGGIVSNEHSRGTIKNIITAPVRRWKILLSKFIYLILDMWLLWLLGLIILSILSGIYFGFSELFTPKLIYTGSKVIEVNYYLYLIKNMFIVSIPLIAFLSLLLFLSTITLNTSLTVGITVIISVLSFLIWPLQVVENFKNVVYTPMWYFDCGYILTNGEFYQLSLDNISYSLSNGIIISLISSIVLLTITFIVYEIRDIKNN